MQDKRSILTVTQAAASYDLVALADVHMDLGIATTDTTNDAWFTAAITRLSAAISKYCRTIFQVETVSEQIYPQIDPYPYQVSGQLSPLQLRRWPVVSVASVAAFESLGNVTNYVAGTDYLLLPDLGQLLKLNPFTGYQSSWDPVPTTVGYVSGYETIPADIQYAALKLIASAFANRGQDAMLMSVSEGGVDRRFWVDTGKDGMFPPSVREILNQYRVPVAV